MQKSKSSAAAARMVPIPSDMILSMVGKPIHLSWAAAGATWILEGVDGDTLRLITPKTRRPMTAKSSDACYVRAFEPKE